MNYMHIIRHRLLFIIAGLVLVSGQLVLISSSTIRAESFAGGGYPSVDKTGGVWHFQFAADKWQAFSVPIKEGLTYNFIKDYCPSLRVAYGMHDGGGYYQIDSGDTFWPGEGYWILFNSDCPLNFSGTDYYYQPKTLEPNKVYAIGTEAKTDILENKRGTCDKLELQTLSSNGAFIISPDDLLVNGFAYWLKNTGSENCAFASGGKPDLVVEQIDILETVYQNKKVRVNAVIKNLGSNIYDLSSNAFSLSAEDFIDTRENNPIPLIYPLPTNSDPMGQDEQLVMEWEGYFIHSGNAIVEIKIDPSNLINESNENNNSLTKNIYVNATSLVCNDSDGGKDYDKKGIASGLYGGVSGFSDDYCSTGGKDKNGNPVNLTEFYCLDGSRYGAIGYFCPNGCKDGACIQSSAKITLSPDAANPPSANYSSGSANVTIGVMKLESSTEDVEVVRMDFNSQGLNGGSLLGIINKLYLYDGATKVAEVMPINNGVLQVRFDPYLIIGKGVGKAITIKADFYQVGSNYPANFSSGLILTLAAGNIVGRDVS